MSIFKFKKNKKEDEKWQVKDKAKKIEKKEVKKEIKKEEKIEETPVKKIISKKSVIAPYVLRSPHVAEKSTILIESNRYVFKVFDRASKTEIKKAVKEVYGVDVLDVKTINIPRKKRTVGRNRGFRPGYRKAIVKVKPGQKIDLLPR